MAVCRWCGDELPVRFDGRDTRRYCSDSHKQQAYAWRKKVSTVEAFVQYLQAAVAKSRATARTDHRQQDDDEEEQDHLPLIVAQTADEVDE